jgi:anti-sigma factor RsiW
MTTSTSLPVRDVERLSAYLDGQLSAADQRELVARLDREPRLRQALEELRQVREALRALPPVRPPRNFMLTPAMVGRASARPSRGFAYAWASALATLAVVFLAVADLTGGGLLAARQSAPAAVPAAELQMAPALMSVPTGSESRGAAENFADQTSPGESQAAGTLSTETPSASEGQLLGGAGTSTDTTTAAPVAQEKQADLTGTPAPTDGSAMRAIPTPSAAAPAESETFLAQDATSGSALPPLAPGRPSLNPLRLIEIGLALLALALAAAAFRTRRSRR